MAITSNSGVHSGEFTLKDFQELSDLSGLQKLDRQFLTEIQAHDPILHQQLLDYRNDPDVLTAIKISELLLALAPLLENFISRRFGIVATVAQTRGRDLAHGRVLEFKHQFVMKKARHYRGSISASFAELNDWLDQQLTASGYYQPDREAAIADYALHLLADAEGHAAALEQLLQWCSLAQKTPEGRLQVADWVSFRVPAKTDYARLVPLQKLSNDPVGRLQTDPAHLRQRDGFKLTDARMAAREIQHEIHYCIYCHDHNGDFCSKGFPHKKSAPELGLASNPLGVTLAGCPLEEKVSEMHLLKRDGLNIAALAMIMVDNPMVPATGHRICNDCMKSCIYQKQAPVNIPQAETGVLSDVLALPWGVEIYELLTRWNPLRCRQYLPKPYNGRKVLVVGQGPAGFSMAHHLTMEGCAVVGIDGLKIEPLPEELLNTPIRDYAVLVENLDERIIGGFGGVAEYGITVRWDKNFLKLIYLSLARRTRFQVIGGVRFGGTLTLQSAWDLGFDHVCIAAGAGLPKVVPMGDSLARGMRQASDFLMALQLTGAAKPDSLYSLQVRLPAVVIGGGLTAIDTATEIQVYYIAQVEKALQRFEHLLDSYGKERAYGRLDAEDSAILEEFLEHGRAVRAERQRAAASGEQPDFIRLLRAWGGVTLLYRRSINESPAYVRNHEEIIKAMEEGIYYAEGMEPLQAELDRYGHIAALNCRRREKNVAGEWLTTSTDVRVPARAVFIAAGATPNTIYEREHPGSLILDGDHFLPHRLDPDGLKSVTASAAHCKTPGFGPFTSYENRGRVVSFIGDTHPVFHGSVVKAIASAKLIYPAITEALARLPASRADESEYAIFRTGISTALSPQVVSIRRLHSSVIELHIRAPMAARHFSSGQFFRLQNYESHGPISMGRLQTGPLVVSGAGVNADCVRMMVLEGSPGARLCASLRPGDPVVLMGPTGAPSEIPHNETILAMGGRWATAAMLTLGRDLRAAGNRVWYLGLFTSATEVFAQEELEAVTDVMVWSTVGGTPIVPRRPQDLSITGGYPELVRQFAAGNLRTDHQEAPVNLGEVNRLLVMGSPRELRQVQDSLQGEFRSCFRHDVTALGTVATPMQCMLKGVCAQCIHWQLDPVTGQRTKAVFACAQQDQPLFGIDIDNVGARTRQNRVADHLSGLWLTYLFEHHPVERV